MTQTITKQTEYEKSIEAIPLCSRCMTYEINNWIFEKRKELDPELTQKIREELKAIKLKQGGCLVCSNSLISDNTIENILKLFEKNKIKKETLNEFKKLFLYLD